MQVAGRRALVLDVLLAVGVTGLGVIEALTGEVHGPLPAALLVAALFGVPLALRRPAPWISFALVYAGFVVAVLLGMSLTNSMASVLGGIAAMYTVATRMPFRWSAVAFVTAYLVVAATALTFTVPNLLWGLVLVGGTWAAGLEIRHRRGLVARLESMTAELERSREEQAAAAVAADRRALARDLHDVVAHGVGVIVVQAGAASRVIGTDPAAAAGAIAAIEDAGREALADLRRMLAVLHDDGGDSVRTPQPGLADVDRLLDRVRGTGLTVDWEQEGTPSAVPAGLDLAAYRVVQEALTNVLKHARARSVRVSIRYRADLLEVDVTDDGRGPATASSAGRGIDGLRARAALYGGAVQASALHPGFRVHASFPVGR